MTTLRSVDHVCAVPRGGAFASAMGLAGAVEAVGVPYRMWHDPRQEGPGGERVRPLPWQEPRGLAWLRYRRRKVLLNRRWRRASRGRADGLEPVHPVRSSREIRFDPTQFTGDVLHLHWIGYAVFDWDVFFSSLPRGHPVVWTQHDFHAFTGGCSYPGSCDRFLRRCEDCPLVLDPGPRDLAAEAFAWKAAHYPQLNLHLVAPSTWLGDLLRRSTLGQQARSIRHVPHAYALDEYTAVDRAEARRSLGFGADDAVVTFGADSVTSRRKGAPELVAALRRLVTARRVRLVVFGGGELGAADTLPDLERLGPLTSRARLAEAYAAADVFCMPSLEDNLPLTGLEALATGTPIAAFDGSGATDYVLPGTTGWLARRGEAEDLARVLAEALDQQRSPQALRADDLRRHVTELCDPARRAKEYLEVYDEAIEARAGFA